MMLSEARADKDEADRKAWRDDQITLAHEKKVAKWLHENQEIGSLNNGKYYYHDENNNYHEIEELAELPASAKWDKLVIQIRDIETGDIRARQHIDIDSSKAKQTATAHELLNKYDLDGRDYYVAVIEKLNGTCIDKFQI